MSAMGKLKRSTKERCPECGGILQIRVRDEPSILRGEEVTIPTEYIGCSRCEYEHETVQKQRRRTFKEID